MRKNKIKNVMVHKADLFDLQPLSNKIVVFHTDIIERKLKQSGLSKKNKLEVLDKIIDNLKSAGL
ncbi:hypothetical protein SDC9_147604 [bioreactor metagenome]|uniref:PemK-like protein n=2 Tax=root TaxID=1 RepID=A0A0X1U7Y5_ANAPI|nr:hypothetical protein [Anaerotignum propionicum]AMJ41043.1 hypothetical protein CPRO_14500 [Anaerotignum propionicum DSM 1682]MEA5056147.1 hypothetical protein [Anaerotignum propionicum]SHE62084.1 hypothetical protein SAMN02745151_01261 [[Clostridium] propionicum DSM 1682] [Anaerotignum propionicum DSM 1682]